MAYSARVKAVIDYIELLTIPSGVGAGGPFVLRPWQRRFLNKVYGPRTKIGLRKVRRAIDSMARKNGKTALIAALVLVHLDGPEWEYNGEIYSAANEREQAGIVFKYVYQMIER
jgi:phage terminase large subunit-like protein